MAKWTERLTSSVYYNIHGLSYDFHTPFKTTKLIKSIDLQLIPFIKPGIYLKLHNWYVTYNYILHTYVTLIVFLNAKFFIIVCRWSVYQALWFLTSCSASFLFLSPPSMFSRLSSAFSVSTVSSEGQNECMRDEATQS